MLTAAMCDRAEAVLERLTKKRYPFTRLHLYTKQGAIIDDPARFTITEATTKAGKNFSHTEWILDEALRAGEGEHWWVAPVYSQATMQYRRIVDRLRGFVQKPDGDSFRLVRVADPIPFTQNKSGLVIECNGARITFRSAEKPDNLYGDDVRTLVGDEISRWREESWHAVYSTLTATKGRAKLIGNVKGRRNWSWQKARKAEAGEPDWSYHKLTANDAIEGGVIDQEIVDQARRDLPEAVFHQLYMAEAADDEGNPFGIEAIGRCIAPLSTKRSVAFGWDLAKSVDWTVGIGLDAGGRTSAFRRFQMPWEETTDELIKLSRGIPTVIDSTGVGDPILERVQKKHPATTGYKFTSQSKQQLMEGLSVAIQRQEIRFPDGPIRNELEAFEYSYTASGVRYSAPEGMHDDCVCALALAVHSFRDRRNRISSADVIPEIPAWNSGLDLG